MTRKIKIIETGEMAELTIIDPKTGVNWIADLMGNCPELGDYDISCDAHPMTQADYDWWLDLTSRKQKADDRVQQMRRRITNDHYQDFINTLNFEGDLENEPEHTQSVCDDYERHCR